MKRLEPKWLDYREMVVPKNASAIQIEECRRAFYAGAASIYDVILDHETPESTEGDMQKMRDLVNELEAFGLSVRPTNPRSQA